MNFRKIEGSCGFWTILLPFERFRRVSLRKCMIGRLGVSIASKACMSVSWINRFSLLCFVEFGCIQFKSTHVCFLMKFQLITQNKSTLLDSRNSSRSKRTIIIGDLEARKLGINWTRSARTYSPLLIFVSVCGLRSFHTRRFESAFCELNGIRWVRHNTFSLKKIRNLLDTDKKTVHMLDRRVSVLGSLWNPTNWKSWISLPVLIFRTLFNFIWAQSRVSSCPVGSTQLNILVRISHFVATTLVLNCGLRSTWHNSNK